MKPKISSILCGGLAAFVALSTMPLVGQEQTAPAIPVEDPTLNGSAKATAVAPLEPVASADTNQEAIPDYKEQIAGGIKERERRLMLLNEAMMKLREAGEQEDAGRVEERIRALLEMPAPAHAGNKMKSELETLRARNDELVIQMMAMEEELKRYRGSSKTSSSGRRTSSTGNSGNAELSALEPGSTR